MHLVKCAIHKKMHFSLLIATNLLIKLNIKHFNLP